MTKSLVTAYSSKTIKISLARTRFASTKSKSFQAFPQQRAVFADSPAQDSGEFAFDICPRETLKMIHSVQDQVLDPLLLESERRGQVMPFPLEFRAL